jgi:hypothetical protein
MAGKYALFDMDATKLAAMQWFEQELPWHGVQPLDNMLRERPTMLVGEAAFITLCALSLVHALWHGRQHMLAWLGALLGGTANDIFFMMLPFVDNFWHAQGFIMITPRLPLYILCVYISFIYIPVVFSWRLPDSRAGWLTRCAASALAGAAPPHPPPPARPPIHREDDTARPSPALRI